MTCFASPHHRSFFLVWQFDVCACMCSDVAYPRSSSNHLRVFLLACLNYEMVYAGRSTGRSSPVVTLSTSHSMETARERPKKIERRRRGGTAGSLGQW